MNKIFPVILRIFDLECHGQTSFTVAFVMFPSFSWILEYWKASTGKIKNLITIKLRYFNCISHSLFFWTKVFSKIFVISYWCHQIGIRERSITVIMRNENNIIHSASGSCKIMVNHYNKNIFYLLTKRLKN